MHLYLFNGIYKYSMTKHAFDCKQSLPVVSAGEDVNCLSAALSEAGSGSSTGCDALGHSGATMSAAAGESSGVRVADHSS